MKIEQIQAITPIFLSLVGGIIAVSVLLTPNVSDAKSASAFGLAGAAIAGASGLAQGSNKGKGDGYQ